MQFVEQVDEGGMQRFEIDLHGFGFLGFFIPGRYQGRLIKLDLYLNEFGKASLRNSLVDKYPKLQRNHKKKPVSFKNVPLPYDV